MVAVRRQGLLYLDQVCWVADEDVGAGYDIQTLDDLRSLTLDRHIEVKGRAKGQSTITITRNEILYGLNQSDKFILAVVVVDGEKHEGPFYIRNPFTQEPEWGVSSQNWDLDQLLARAERIA